MSAIWDELKISDVVYAYRKAKADAFRDRYAGAVERFADFEIDLPRNLTNFYARLKSGEIGEIVEENKGNVCFMSKRLSLEPKKLPEQPSHGFFSDSWRAFRQLSNQNDLIPELRLVGDFPVEIHLISALWINLIGHRYDEALSGCAYGSRLRRLRPHPKSGSSKTSYHIEAVGSYEPYYNPYKRWRELGLRVMREEVGAGRAVAALTLDFSNYYHNVDPSFIGNEAYIKKIGLKPKPMHSAITAALIQTLHFWGSDARAKLHEMEQDLPAGNAIGLPIGISATPLIANALLLELDRDIRRNLTPIYYGRYVDDLFLVLRDPGDINSSEDFLNFISQKTSTIHKAEADKIFEIRLPGDYQGNSILRLKPSKQKAFFLRGKQGLDLLDNIDHQIREVASERRLMPSPNNLDRTAAAKVLTAAASITEEPDTLRKADGLVIRRLGWSIQLRSAEILARDLRPDAWKTERDNFYDFALRNIIRPDRILDHLDYVPRILSLAVALEDWTDALCLYENTIRSINELSLASKLHGTVNGLKVVLSDSTFWTGLEQAVHSMARLAIISSISWDSSNGQARTIKGDGMQLCKKLSLPEGQENIQALALRIREADLAKTSYKDHIRRNATSQRSISEGEVELSSHYKNYRALVEFLSLSISDTEHSAQRVRSEALSHDNLNSSVIPFVFPTRPYTTQEISLFLPRECVFGPPPKPAANWARYTRAVRGVWVSTGEYEEEQQFKLDETDTAEALQPEIEEDQRLPNLMYADLGDTSNAREIYLGVSSLLTEDKSFSSGAYGKTDLSIERYDRIQTIVNQAIAARPRPTHLILPELSLPERWVSTVAGILQQSGINLIAGLDYELYGNDEICSSAVLVLDDNRLGYSSAVQIRQPKILPAPGEEQSLHTTFGKKWRHNKARKQIYSHHGFDFGVLICSELQNINNRALMQGRIDCLFVLSWNQDLETFSALVESACLDIHSYIALVNNRKFGDSRVRAPFKESHKRDVCRIRGGKNEHLVVVPISSQELRQFQSRSKNWPSSGDPFKPVPEGFMISTGRKMTPK